MVVGSFSSCSSNSFLMLQEAFTKVRLAPAPKVLRLAVELLVLVHVVDVFSDDKVWFLLEVDGP